MTPRLVPAPLDASASAGAGLGPDSVVLLTGGARGITAACAMALARTSGCHIELLGRTPLPEGLEAPAIAAAADAPALRAALVGQGVRTPAEVEAAVRRILSAREVRGTLDAISPLAASVHYQPDDVSDAGAVRTVIEEICARHGRLDGAIHGAGVLEDRLLADKTPESFARVFGTKVEGARSLAAALDGRPEVGFLVLFGSVSGVFGNSGQVDYSAANDALDTLARMWDGRVARRVVALDWGPWGSTAGGMVSPELEREYARRGIVPIAPEEGVAALFAELAWGHPGRSQVVYMTSR